MNFKATIIETVGFKRELAVIRFCEADIQGEGSTALSTAWDLAIAHAKKSGLDSNFRVVLETL